MTLSDSVEGRPGLFLRITRVSRSRQDAPVMVETSSTRYMPPSLYGPSSSRPVSSWKWWYERSAKGRERGRKREKEGRDKRTLPPLTSYILHNITVVCPRGKIELARNGSGISSTASTPIFFEFIDTIGMIPGALVFARSLASITLRFII